MFTKEELNKFSQNGFILKQGLFSPEYVAQLKDEVNLSLIHI